MELQKVQQFYFDENRKAVIELEEGTRHIVPADYVIFAVGQKPEGTEDMGLELTHGPYILADADLRTSMEAVYAAGDAVTGTKSVIAAIAAGRRAAEQMDLYLGGDGDISEEDVYKRQAQVILRWNLQKGVVVIPGSSNPEHIRENISLFDFELTREEMEQINALDRGEKHDWY